MSDFGIDPDHKRDMPKRKKAATGGKSPTSRSNKWLIDQGYLVDDKAESYNAFTRKRHDLFNFIDIAAIHPDKQGVLGVQTTSEGNLNARIKKAENLWTYWVYLEAGTPVEFHGWGKEGRIWRPKIVRVSYAD